MFDSHKASHWQHSHLLSPDLDEQADHQSKQPESNTDLTSSYTGFDYSIEASQTFEQTQACVETNCCPTCLKARTAKHILKSRQSKRILCSQKAEDLDMGDASGSEVSTSDSTSQDLLVMPLLCTRGQQCLMDGGVIEVATWFLEGAVW